jgi:asparagine synthase (glutamine-hydrolysing)
MDRNAMAHGVETRLPYLDPRLATLALALPPEMLVRDGWTKWPLRHTLAARGGAVPAWRRGKRWFGAPQSLWLQGALKPLVKAFSEDPHPAWGSIADPSDLRRILSAWAVRPPSATWDDQIFEMLSLERFLRVWLPASRSTPS